VARLRAPASTSTKWFCRGRRRPLTSARPSTARRCGLAGNAVLAGHRDTSFAFLARLARGDALLVETPTGRSRRYRVVETRVVDVGDRRPFARTREPTLTLITGYPFDAVWPGTRLRYVVRAEAAGY
jgi:sortase A